MALSYYANAMPTFSVSQKMSWNSAFSTFFPFFYTFGPNFMFLSKHIFSKNLEFQSAFIVKT
jgi:hypothetical protein